MVRKRNARKRDRRLYWGRRVPQTAILVCMCLVIAACGSRSGHVSTADGDGPEYGVSLEEWSRAIGEERDAAAPSESSVNPALTAEYETLTWEDLIAPNFSGEDVLDDYLEELATIEDGSPEANALYEKMQKHYDGEAVNVELDGAKVQLAGFVAPLTYDDDIITEFLLVPYFGACIHVPPPPSYQTVLVTVDEANGLTIEEGWGAVWVAGMLSVSKATTDLATASYTITHAVSGVYDEY